MWELDCEVRWVLKNWCFWTVVLEKTLESPLDCKEIPPVLPKGDQSWIFIGRMDAEAETPILWPPHVKNSLIRKDSDVGKDWRQEEKGTTEDEMVGWHYWLDGYEFEQALGVDDGQGSLVCCSPWGRKESDTAEWLDCTDKSSESSVMTPRVDLCSPDCYSHAAYCHLYLKPLRPTASFQLCRRHSVCGAIQPCILASYKQVFNQSVSGAVSGIHGGDK